MHDICAQIERIRTELTAASDAIFDYAETAFEEYRSAACLKELLTRNGFSLRAEEIAGLKTAFCAEAGTGEPLIAFLGEYDALPDLSQEAGVCTPSPIVEHGPGHGCGHHVLGTAAAGAAIATWDFLKRNNKSGTVRFYGCPAEEGGAGKAFMARAGAFEGVDAALTWHATDDNNVWSMNFLASLNARFHFTGISAHAASQGHIGRSALEGVELMSVGANYLRGHVERDVCINYAVIDAGGTAANNFPAKATVSYKIRANTMAKAHAALARLCDIANGAALMSGTTVEFEHISGSSELIPNRTLERLLHEKLMEVGSVPYTQKDWDFAAQIRETFPENAEESTCNTLSMLYGDAASALIPQIRGKAINDIVYPYVPIAMAKYGSTDVCDVSWFTPVAQVTTACYAKDTPGHSWFEVAQGKQPLCHNGMINAAKTLALTAAALFAAPEKLSAVQAEWADRRSQKTYHCPVPEHAPSRL